MNRNHISQIVVSVVVGAILGVGGTYLQFAPRIARLEALVSANGTTTRVAPAGEPQTPPAAQAASLSSGAPDSIVRISAEVQRAYVRESFGELMGQNFSDADFTAFRKNGVTKTVVDSLRRDARFLAIVLGLQATEAARRQALLRNAGQPIHRTWAECGKVSRECQTEAGRKAEQLLAGAIVQLANDLIKKRPEDIRKLSVP